MARKKRKVKTSSSDIGSALRKIWRFSPERRDFLESVRFRAYNVWCVRCNACGEVKRQTEIEVDHIEPVGAIPGSRNSTPSDTWDQRIFNLFFKPNNYQALCIACHRVKTNRERGKMGKT